MTFALQPIGHSLKPESVAQVADPDVDSEVLTSIEPDPNAQLEELGKMLDQLDKPLPDETSQQVKTELLTSEY